MKPGDPADIRALLCYPTHENCAEVADAFAIDGLDAKVYRGRLTKGDDTNCWNSDADAAEEIGLPVTATVCVTCDHRKTCEAEGYLADLRAAKESQIAIATHARVSHGGFSDVATGRQYLSIHEDPTGVLRPTADATEGDVAAAANILRRMLEDPDWLNYFGGFVSRDEDGKMVPNERLAERKDALFEFTKLLLETAERALVAITAAETTTEWKSGPKSSKAAGIERLLFQETRQAQVSFSGSPWRILIGAATGEVFSAGIIVDVLLKPGSKGAPAEAMLSKRLLATWDNLPNARTATVWINDATADLLTLEQIFGRRVIDGTPRGRLALKRKIVQIPKDITRSTAKKTVQSVLRGILADRPRIAKAGVICHRPHAKAVAALGPPFQDRVAKIAYFGSGEDRSSNAWLDECDAIIVLGTPRLRPGAIRERLFQIGDVGAACRQPEWLAYRWTGQTESGEAVEVTAKGYPEDPAWRQAHRSLCRAALIQAIGRGRQVNDSGIEAVVVTTEECGAVLSDQHSDTLGALASRVLDAMRRATAENSNIYILEFSAVTTFVVANSLGISMRRAREVLSHLETRGLVSRVGERKGWRLVAHTEQKAE